MSNDITSDDADGGQKNQRLFNLLGIMFISGLFATIAFDIWGQVISPSLGLAKLSPHSLAMLFLKAIGLSGSAYGGYSLHFIFVGALGYPFGWLFIFRPLWNKVGLPSMPIVAALVFGFGLWVFAIGGITYFVGLEPFLGFTQITWVALVGHMLYGAVLVGVIHLFQDV